MSTQVEHSRMFRRGRALGYLEEHDRHLTAKHDPQFSFGFIGCGMMGQEHIYNTLLLGRARVVASMILQPRALKLRRS